jgi:hypothetical protein
MDFHNDKKQIKHSPQNKTVAVATYEAGAKVIVNALNYYFGQSFTQNQCVEMMHKNTSNSLKDIATHLEKHEHSVEEAIKFLREIAEEMEAQALVVSMRDELKFDSPNAQQNT